MSFHSLPGINDNETIPRRKLRKSSGIRDGTHDLPRTSNKRDKSFHYHLFYYMVVIVLYLIERLIKKRNVFENTDVRSGGK